MHLFQPPIRVKTEVHCRLPDRFRTRQRTAWSDSNRLGQEVDSFLAGPSFDRAGNLYFVDIPFGRIFRLTQAGACDLVAHYDGWPNGLKIHRDGRIFIADYKCGLVVLDPASGRTEPLLASRNSEGFKGLNDLVFAANGDCYFTDQGQTGMHDPTGRVYRLAASGRLDCLMDNIPSPNGIVLNNAENRLFVAVTRQNAVWRAPLMPDGSVSKVGTFLQLSGGQAGPDGLAIDVEDGLYVCHLGIGVWRFDANGIPTHLIEACVGHHMTNLAFGGSDGRQLFITESDTGSILRCEAPVAGKPMFAHHG
ncbi:MAG TPA: SMP-30/gluconolactonase/LRE family protein [Stellaceae bacterium]|nr:SMP-30/gluconolactonase/LRE family protein [Stellaceae bacterium]